MNTTFDLASPSAHPSRPERLLRLRDVQKHVPLGRTTIYGKIARGEFPRPVSLGGNAVAWVQSEIQAWIQARVNEKA